MCRACAALGITCHNELGKPNWMDGATRQQEMIERIKTQVKSGSSSRRERRAAEDGHHFIIFSENDYTNQSSAKGGGTQSGTQSGDSHSPSRAAGEGYVNNNGGRLVSVATRNPPLLTQTRPEALPPSPPGIRTYSTQRVETSQLVSNVPGELPISGARSPIVSFPRAWEMDFVAMYLDYVFPFLFPFYHPPLAGTGRAWLFTFLRQSDAIYHLVISLSSYFFTIGLNDAHPGKHESCKSLVWDQVFKQADLSFGMIQHDLAEASRPGVETTLLEKARLMESIIQMLIFGSFLGKSANWAMHLSPALALFEELYKEHSLSSDDEPVMLRILERMAWPSDSELAFGRPIWNPDQAAFRFFTATLVFLDVVAGTALERTPRLATYHSGILGDVKPDDVAVPIDLSAFVGCQNWAILSVSSIAALDAWKKDMKRNGSLSMPELVQRARHISQTLDRGLSRLETSSASHPQHNRGNNRLRPYYHCTRSTSADLSSTATRVWALAARIYLEVVVSGWQLSNAEIGRNVAEVVATIESLETLDHVRALAWPICVAGCAAEPGMREKVIGIVARVGDRQTPSTICEAGEIMKAMWARRENMEDEEWDMAACFRILGPPALLT